VILKPIVASIWAVVLAEKTMPVLAAIEPYSLPGALTVGLLFQPVHQGCTRW